MLTIRFQRTGRSKQPYYRVVVSEKTKDMYGRHLEILGTYNPRSKEVILKADRIKHWLDKGAQASAVVFNLLVRQGLIQGKKQKAVAISKRRQAKQDKAKADKEEVTGKEAQASTAEKEASVDQVGNEAEAKAEAEPKTE